MWIKIQSEEYDRLNATIDRFKSEASKPKTVDPVRSTAILKEKEETIKKLVKELNAEKALSKSYADAANALRETIKEYQTVVKVIRNINPGAITVQQVVVPEVAQDWEDDDIGW